MRGLLKYVGVRMKPCNRSHMPACGLHYSTVARESNDYTSDNKIMSNLNKEEVEEQRVITKSCTNVNLFDQMRW